MTSAPECTDSTTWQTTIPGNIPIPSSCRRGGLRSQGYTIYTILRRPSHLAGGRRQRGWDGAGTATKRGTHQAWIRRRQCVVGVCLDLWFIGRRGGGDPSRGLAAYPAPMESQRVGGQPTRTKESTSRRPGSVASWFRRCLVGRRATPTRGSRDRRHGRAAYSAKRGTGMCGRHATPIYTRATKSTHTHTHTHTSLPPRAIT